MARNKESTAPTSSVEQGEGSGRPGLLKRLAVAGIMAGAMFNTTGCSVLVAMEAAESRHIPEDERKHTEQLVLSRVQQRVKDFEERAAADDSKVSVVSEGDELRLAEYGYGPLSYTDEKRGVEVRGFDGISFHLDREDGDTTTVEISDATVGLCHKGEEFIYCHDEYMHPGSRAEFTFSVPGDHLSGKDLTSDEVLSILTLPGAQMTNFYVSDGPVSTSIEIGPDGSLKGKQVYWADYPGDRNYFFDSISDERETLQGMVQQYHDGLGE